MVATLFALYAASLQIRPPDAEVPLEAAQNQLVITLEVNGRPAKFSLDSGSFEVRVQTTTAMELGLFNPKGLPGNAVSIIQTSFEADMKIGNLKLAKVPLQ